MSAKKKAMRIIAGCEARTNAAFTKMTGWQSIHMIVLRPHATIAGAWWTKWDGVAPEQVVHEKYMEAAS